MLLKNAIKATLAKVEISPHKRWPFLRKYSGLANLSAQGVYLCSFCGCIHRNKNLWHPEGVNCPRCDCIGRERFEYFCLLSEITRTNGLSQPMVANCPAFKSLSLLEFSPRRNTHRRELLNATFKDYVASDFDNSLHQGDIALDLTNAHQIGQLQTRFDIILLAHVLEHIPNYRLALFNLKSLLKPGGFALLQVPLLEPSYTKVTWDEFHGDQTRVYHRFAFDIIEELAGIFPRICTYIVDLTPPTPGHPEVKAQKYDWFGRHPDACLVQVGNATNQIYGFGAPEYCDAFILRND